MIRDQDLNDFREALKTYFEYNPEGPKTLQLNKTLSLKLLNLLNNLEELTVDNIIPYYKLDYFSLNELMPYIHTEMARKIADKLIADKYVIFSQTDDDPLGVRTRASTILLKRGDNE